MENEDQTIEYQEEPKAEIKNNGSGNGIIIGSAMISATLLIFSGVQLYIAKTSPRSVAPETNAAPANQDLNALQEEVIPSDGVVLPVTWGDLGKQMVQTGIIDEAQFAALYAERGGLPQDMLALLDSSNNGQITMTSQNSGILLNLLWALGLGNKNPVLENGPMQNPQYGGAGNFASTGGWTLTQGKAMAHYDAHQFVTLTPSEQSLVASVAKNIYRPCCGNSVYFPDCNHGMAMLGLLELMASQGASEGQMYKTALAVNSYWFPDNYLTIAQYLQGKGIDWKTVNPKDVLAANFSSSQGYAQIVAQAQPAQSKASGGCGV